MDNRLNLTTAGTTAFRCLVYVGAAGGILGFISAPAKNTSLLVLGLVVVGLIVAFALMVLFLCRPHMTGNVPTLTLGRPTKTQMKVLKVMALCVLLPMSSDWSFGFCFFVSIGLMLAGLTALAGLAFGPNEGRPDTPAKGNPHGRTPAGQLATVLARMMDSSRPPLPDLSSGEIAARADLFDRKGKIRIDRRSDTVTVTARDGYRATYRLSDGSPVKGTA